MQIREININNSNRARQLKTKIERIFRGSNIIFKRRHSLRRLLNYAMIAIQRKLRSAYIFGYPYNLVIESTNICNLHCPLCPTGQGLNGRAKGKMSFINFKRIIEELGGYIYSLRLENWGEPLLNEEIFEMISYAKSKKIVTSFNTNFSVLNEKNAERLILSGLDHIKISLDGVSQETYVKYRVGGDFNKIIDNIRLLVRKRAQLSKKNPFIEIQFIVMRHNEDEIDRISQLCAELGVDGLALEGLHPDMREELFSQDSRSIDKFKSWLPKKSKYSLFDYKNNRRKYNPKICNALWTSMVINWDGTISPCCSVYDKKYDFGNIFEDGLKKVWNNQKYRASRKLMGRKKKSGVETVCINCFKNGIVYNA